MSGDEAAVKVDNVNKSFRLPHEKAGSVKGLLTGLGRRQRGFEKQHVLKKISFEIKRGEFFGIVGRNGSGKSTLLKLLAGIYTPDSGGITVNGKLTPFIELGVGFNPELTGRENVFLNGALLGFNRKEMSAMYEGIVKFAELERFMDQKLKNYSSGMQVRLAFSIAIRAKSDILVLDEVLAVGDAAFQQKCTEYFREVKNSGQTVILVTHDMKSVVDFCDQAMLISGGKIKLLADPNTIAEAYDEINREETGSEELVASSDRVSSGAEIESVAVRNPDSGKEKQFFKYAENIEVVVRYKLLKDIKDATADIGLRLGKNGPYYFYTTSDEHDVAVGGQAGQTIELALKIRNIFNEGAFYVATSLFDSSSYEVYARDRQAAKIITGNLPGTGLVYPEHELIIKRN